VPGWPSHHWYRADFCAFLLAGLTLALVYICILLGTYLRADVAAKPKNFVKNMAMYGRLISFLSGGGNWSFSLDNR